MNKSYYCYLITTRRHWGRSSLTCCSRLWRRDNFFRVVRTPQGSIVHACLTETIMRKIKYLFLKAGDQPGRGNHEKNLFKQVSCPVAQPMVAYQQCWQAPSNLTGSKANVTEKIHPFDRKQAYWVQIKGLLDLFLALLNLLILVDQFYSKNQDLCFGRLETVSKLLTGCGRGCATGVTSAGTIKRSLAWLMEHLTRVQGSKFPALFLSSASSFLRSSQYLG